jgi:hypothetical protein
MAMVLTHEMLSFLSRQDRFWSLFVPRVLSMIARPLLL